MNFYTNLTFKVQKGRGLGSRDPISKFWEPLITFERIELSASNLVQTYWRDPSCVWTIKRPLSERVLGRVSRDPISKFWDPLITFEQIELFTSNLVQT